MKPEYSIIVPLLNEVESLPLLQQAIDEAMQKNGLKSFEVIYMDDGSTDASWPLIQKMTEHYPHVQGIQLNRHMGKASALASGIFHAQGHYIITMDADLQNDPKDIPLLLDKVQDGYDLVCGWRRRRYDSKARVFLSYIFNFVVSALTRVPLHDSNCGLKAGRAEAFRAIKLYGQLHRYIPLLAVAHGFRTTETEIHHMPRRFGKSRYSITRYFYAARDLLVALAITKYSKISRINHLGFKAIAIAGMAGVIFFGFAISLSAGLSLCLISCALLMWLYCKQREYVRYHFDGSCVPVRAHIRS